MLPLSFILVFFVVSIASLSPPTFSSFPHSLPPPLPAPPYPFEPPLACRSDLWPSSLHRPPPPQPSNALPVSGNLQRLCLPRWHLSYLFTSGPDTGAWGQSIPPLPTPALPSYSASVLWTPCPAPVPGLCTQLPKAPGLNVKPSHAWLPH